ncbi:MAG TPA: hypothetical protein VF103_14790, partial [Polyangiaceae bacterium]
MPSDRPPPEPSGRGSDPASRRKPTGAVRDGTIAFALVLAGFVAVALGAPTTYRSSAIVGVERVPGSSPFELPKPTEAIPDLRRAALEPGLLATLAKEESPTPPADVSERIASSLTVDSEDGRKFSFSATAPTPERSQRIANMLAEQAAKRAVQVLDPRPPSPDANAKAKADLLEFLTTHPDIANEPDPMPVRTGPDPLVLALRAERARIASKLADPTARSSENPYDEPTPLENPEFLKRRLREIETALEARTNPKRLPAPAASSSRTTTADRAEWQRLLRAASENTSTAPAAAPAARLRVTLAKAGLPRSPIEPDRPRLVLVGVLMASLAGVLAGILRARLEARAVRRYGMITGAHAALKMPATTLRISRSELPKMLAPRSEPVPTPIPAAPANPAPTTPIPPAPRVPAPITPIPMAPIAPVPMTPIPPAPIVPAPITPIPPAPKGPGPLTPAPLTPAPLAEMPAPTPTPIAALPIRPIAAAPKEEPVAPI